MVDDEYQLTVVIENDILDHLTDKEFSLCLKKFLKENDEDSTANVAFAAKAYNRYSSRTPFLWKNSYSIAAVDEGFGKGNIDTLGTVRTDIKTISTQRSASLGPLWSDFEVKYDSKAPKDGFGFDVDEPSGKGAAAIVYQDVSVDGKDPVPAPFFVSNSLHKSPPLITLVPCERVMVCFEKGVGVGTMTTHVGDYDTVITFTKEERNQTWKLFNNGHWDKVLV